MANDPSFAPPLSQLGSSSLVSLDVASSPTAGQGYALNPQGHIPIVAKDGNWTMEYVTVAVNLASTAAHTGGSTTVTIPGLAVGDLCFLIGFASDTGNNRPFHRHTIPLCTTADTIVLEYFNADAVTNDPTSVTHYFLVIHRFL